MNIQNVNEVDPTFLCTDPAFPPGRTAVKYETCKRVWATLRGFDWLFNSHTGTNMIPDNGCKP